MNDATHNDLFFRGVLNLERGETHLKEERGEISTMSTNLDQNSICSSRQGKLFKLAQMPY